MAKRKETDAKAENADYDLADIYEEGRKPLGWGKAMAILDIPDAAQMMPPLPTYISRSFPLFNLALAD